MFCTADKAGLKWEGFNAPIGPDDEEWEKAAGRERGRMKTFERGWSGKTWPGRELGPPLTADGGTSSITSVKQKHIVAFWQADIYPEPGHCTSFSRDHMLPENRLFDGKLGLTHAALNIQLNSSDFSKVEKKMRGKG